MTSNRSSSSSPDDRQRQENASPYQQQNKQAQGGARTAPSREPSQTPQEQVPQQSGKPPAGGEKRDWDHEASSTMPTACPTDDKSDQWGGDVTAEYSEEEGPGSDSVPEGEKCDDPDDILEALKAKLKQKQEEAQDAQQGSAQLTANIKQLEGLSKSIRQTVAKYQLGYEKSAEQKREAQSYHKTKMCTVACALSEESQKAIKAIRDEELQEIADAKKSIADREADARQSQIAYDKAVEDLKSAEDRLPRWLAVDKWIADLLRELAEVAKKIDAAEDHHDYCSMSVYLPKYAELLEAMEVPVQPPDQFAAKLWELWCEIKDLKEARSKSLQLQDAAKRRWDDAIAAHAALQAAFEQTVLSRIETELPDCAEEGGVRSPERATAMS
ncbi:hypothetical protein AYO47_03240 [Planctomyces sp. SCGC AG-212-M04]|nr:hypothetical protein AYO47_03240 [Planctomyces sp. SCGC AG-212-M04]